jgi:hypothetical protein
MGSGIWKNISLSTPHETGWKAFSTRLQWKPEAPILFSLSLAIPLRELSCSPDVYMVNWVSIHAITNLRIKLFFIC